MSSRSSSEAPFGPRSALAKLARAHATTLFFGAVGILYFSRAETPASTSPHGIGPHGTSPHADIPTRAIERGREVYIREGCINCHSQYIRPRTDVEIFGPHRAVDRSQTPLLIGNRRQGPDLTNVGSRRSAAWHKLHLLDPRSLMPASRMPSYAHLFAENDSRGEDLVAYLESLGRDSATEWYEITRSQDLGDTMDAGSPRRGQRIFGEYCASCHGAAGRGDGPLAAEVYRPAMNLRKKNFWLISWGPGAEPEATALARMVKFGMPGTSMPGHEYLTDAQIADVVAFVQTLRGRDEPMVAEERP